MNLYLKFKSVCISTKFNGLFVGKIRLHKIRLHSWRGGRLTLSPYWKGKITFVQRQQNCLSIFANHNIILTFFFSYSEKQWWVKKEKKSLQCCNTNQAELVIIVFAMQVHCLTPLTARREN